MPDTTSQIDQVEKPDDATEDSKADESRPENDEANDSVSSCPDPYYPPIIYLPEVIVNSGEDDEEEMFKIRARLYRYAHECDPPEWKERGTGDIRILKHIEENTCRIVMRREKTLKLCANHLITPWMELKKNCVSDKAWVWKTQADYADGESKQETLAAKFGNVENAKKWEKAFEQARKHVLEKEAEKILEEEGQELPTKPGKTLSDSKETKTESSDGDGTVETKEESVTKESDEVVDKIGELTVN